MALPAEWIPRDPPEVIAERHRALIADHTEAVRKVRRRRESSRANLRLASKAAIEKRQAEREALIEDVEWLMPTEIPERIPARLGTTMEALARRLRRAGRPDLALPFERLWQRERARRAA